MAEHNEIGKIGENIARTFLMKHGFSIESTNFRTKYGEIDIIAKKDNRYRFLEVKSVKVTSFSTIKNLSVRPEDNLTINKWKRILISVEIYLNSLAKNQEILWQIDLICVYINMETREGKAILIENIHKE